ncbi:MAG TPA: hypothetical protein VIJ62_01640, partial [Rhizomicrobium sp.]
NPPGFRRCDVARIIGGGTGSRHGLGPAIVPRPQETVLQRVYFDFKSSIAFLFTFYFKGAGTIPVMTCFYCLFSLSSVSVRQPQRGEDTLIARAPARGN